MAKMTELAGVARALAIIAAGVALPREEANRVAEIASLLEKASKVEVKISKADLAAALKPLLDERFAALSARVKALENANAST